MASTRRRVVFSEATEGDVIRTLRQVHGWMTNLLFAGGIHPDDTAAARDIMAGIAYLLSPVERVEVRVERPPYKREASSEAQATE